jgi:hypothetical protein
MTKTAPKAIDHDVNFMIGAGEDAGEGRAGLTGVALST